MVHNNNRIFSFIVLLLLAVKTRYYVNFITAGKKDRNKTKIIQTWISQAIVNDDRMVQLCCVSTSADSAIGLYLSVKSINGYQLAANLLDL